MTTMKHFRLLLSALAVLMLLATCKKTEEVLIPGNVAPPDPTIENVVKENYINKLYINLLGRKPSEAEFNNGLVILNKNNLSNDNRIEIINSVLSDDEYYIRSYQIARDDLLQGADIAYFALWIEILENEITKTGDSAQIATYYGYIAKLELMLTIADDLKSGAIDVIGMHRRCVDNLVYDEINMGTENFVISMYQNFLFREPTDQVLRVASQMVNGIQSVVFLQVGDSKDDFIDIMLDSREYYEGQVRNLYLRYLFREPNTEEMAANASSYEANNDYAAIQRAVLSSDEYVGL